MNVTFKDGSVLDLEVCGTDIHENLIIETTSEEYEKVKSIILNPEATKEIKVDDKVFYDYTNVKAFGSDINNDKKTHIKAILTYGKDVTNVIADLVSKINILEKEKETILSEVSDLTERNATLEQSQAEQDEVLDYILTSDVTSNEKETVDIVEEGV